MAMSCKQNLRLFSKVMFCMNIYPTSNLIYQVIFKLHVLLYCHVFVHVGGGFVWWVWRQIYLCQGSIAGYGE